MGGPARAPARVRRPARRRPLRRGRPGPGHPPSHPRADGELRADEQLVAWAYQIARNAIVDHYRARGGDREVPEGATFEETLGAVQSEGDPGDGVRSEMARCLSPMVQRLPDLYREAIELTDLDGLTQAAAAERLELSLPGLKARVRRGREKLKEMLLACCEVATDSRGRPVEYRRSGPCGCAGRSLPRPDASATER